MAGLASFWAILVGYLSTCWPLQLLVGKQLLAKETADILLKEGLSCLC